MPRRTFLLGIAGLVIILLWFILYTIDTVVPIFTSKIDFVIYGVVGIVGVLLAF